jgi:hypothetical protein
MRGSTRTWERLPRRPYGVLRKVDSALLRLKSEGATGDQASTTIECEVLDRPLDKDQNTALERDEIQKVDKSPDDPRRQTSNLHTEDIGHRRRAADHGERSLPLYLSHPAVNEEFNSSYVAALV